MAEKVLERGPVVPSQPVMIDGLRKLCDGEQRVYDWLMAHSFKGKLMIHSRVVEREIIPEGIYSLSVSKYVRNLRLYGYISYPDPRGNQHQYKITLLHIEPEKVEYDEDNQGVMTL